MNGSTGHQTGHDPDAAEDFTRGVGVDPTQEEIDIYRRLEGEDATGSPPTVDGPPAD